MTNTIESETKAAQDRLRCMLRIRAFEEAVEQVFREGQIQGTAHTAIGQEAIPVGVCDALRTGDSITSTHRGHGHLIARGGDPARMMAELFGRETGYCHGRGGSQMMVVPEIGFLGGNGITGGSLPVATGVALHHRLQRTDHVVICFFGDGAANQGTFHESLNLAALWQLPVVFVCENNGYAMSLPVHRSTAGGGPAVRALAYGIPGKTLDGNDLDSVRAAAQAAVSRAREGQGPSLLECHTYRLSGHSRGDPRVYRARAEEQAAWEHEPIKRYDRQLRQQGQWDDDRERDARESIDREIRAALEFARQSPQTRAFHLETT